MIVALIRENELDDNTEFLGLFRFDQGSPNYGIFSVKAVVKPVLKATGVNLSEVYYFKFHGNGDFSTTGMHGTRLFSDEELENDQAS